VNGRRVSVPLQLHDNDRLTFAEQELVFRNPGGAGPESRSKEPETRELPTSATLQHNLTTIVVVDIRDFTRLARTVPEGVLSQTIGTWFFRVGKIAEEWGSWGQQYMGDAVMAVWVHDHRSHLPNDLVHALLAVCEIDRATAEISQTLPLPGPLRIGAGVATGPAVLGGSFYTALGDTVNMAIRLEAATKTVGRSVVLADSTYRALAGREVLGSQRVEVNVKGHETPVPAWATSFEDLAGFLGTAGARHTKNFPRNGDGSDFDPDRDPTIVPRVSSLVNED
jgi:adenylate cyclase